MQANAELFSELRAKLNLLQKDVAGGPVMEKQASLDADSLNEVVSKVHDRWLGSIDKEEPNIADEFLREMKDAINLIHATEGYPNVKVAKARDSGPDWLVKIVKGNKAMQDAIK